MTERTDDEPTPPRHANPVTLEGALAAVASWNSIPGSREPRRAHKVAIALVDEVERLRSEIAAMTEREAWARAKMGEFQAAYEANGAEIERLRTLCRDISWRADCAEQQLAAIRAAVPEIIGCGKGAACTQDNHGWHSCCLARMALGRLGVIPAQPEAAASDDDGA